MSLRKMICVVLSCMLIIGTTSIPVAAAEVEYADSPDFEMNFMDYRATGSFSVSVPAYSKARAGGSFPLVAGETVTIKASYAPFSASVDFGLVAPDGRFYYFNVTSGSIDKTIQVDQNGDYVFQIRNNSASEVKVSGFVNY